MKARILNADEPRVIDDVIALKDRALLQPDILCADPKEYFRFTAEYVRTKCNGGEGGHQVYVVEDDSGDVRGVGILRKEGRIRWLIFEPDKYDEVHRAWRERISQDYPERTGKVSSMSAMQRLTESADKMFTTGERVIEGLSVSHRNLDS